MLEIKVELADNRQRIDTFLITKLNMSRSKVQKLIQSEEILVNDKVAKNSYAVKENDIVTILEHEIETLDIEPENIPLNIVYEDDDLIIVNKPNGMVVHPAVGNTHGTLVNALVYHFKKLSSKNGANRPGIVHRIDAQTTGLLVVAKNDKAHEMLAKQLEEKTTTRKYIALVWGVINNDTGTVDAPIGRDINDRKKMTVIASGKHAVTHFKVLKRFKNATLVELQLETGRTHQIRVHMNYIGFPIINDQVYGKKRTINDEGQCLHAKTLGFIHPTTKKYVEFDSNIPKKIEDIINIFEKE